MPAFLDTSALIKYFAEETGTEEIRRLIGSETPLWVSELTTVEGVSALCPKRFAKGRSRPANSTASCGRVCCFLFRAAAKFFRSMMQERRERAPFSAPGPFRTVSDRSMPFNSLRQ
ncbi:MAG: PIN domain-containing protein [candidate division NC10 bacterium]|nr:PIN domain-containing protein [candidate division NC10 bacterium]